MCRVNQRGPTIAPTASKMDYMCENMLPSVDESLRAWRGESGLTPYRGEVGDCLKTSGSAMVDVVDDSNAEWHSHWWHAS